jgi:hypothetical protein
LHALCLFCSLPSQYTYDHASGRVSAGIVRDLRGHSSGRRC